MAKKNETNTSFTKDSIGVMLEDNKEYTFDEVDNLIKEFLKREVE